MRIFILLIYILFVSCDNSIIEETNYTVIEYKDNELKYMFDQAESTELKKSEIIEIENIIQPIVKKHIDEFNNKSTDKDYVFYRQYVPVILPNGEKIIWINFLCSVGKTNDYWKKNIISVSDGGACFFNLKVNLDKKVYFDYRVNGIARI